MGCAITITDEPAVRASERDLLSLTAVQEGTCRCCFARETAAACARGRGWAALPPHAASCPPACATPAAVLDPGGAGKGLAPSTP